MAQNSAYLTVPAKRTDLAHNEAVLMALQANARAIAEGHPEQTATHLLHLDIDHKHPADIVRRFERAFREHPDAQVIGGLNFRRSEPYDPCAFETDEHGNSSAWASWPEGVLPVDRIGAASLCMSVDVFPKLAYPWFGYDYSLPGWAQWPNCTIDDLIQAKFDGVDMWFSRRCEDAGVPIYVDTRIQSPHLRNSWVGAQTWQSFQRTPKFRYGRNAYAVRLEQLQEGAPELFTEPGRVLYVGANKWRHHYAPELRQAGNTLALLEIDEGNAKYHETSGVFDEVQRGDVTQLAVSDQYDHAMWWHGPEHVDLSQLPDALKGLELAVKPGGLVVVGCPWGKADSSSAYGNDHEEHKAALYAEDFKRLGYQVSTGGIKNSYYSSLVAWKRVT